MVVPASFEGLSQDERQSLQNIPLIFEANRTALERELGAAMQIVTQAPAEGPRWLIGPRKCNSALAALDLPEADKPYLWLDRAWRLLVSEAKTAAGVWETFNLLRSLARQESGIFQVDDCHSVEEAIERITAEVRECYPAFELRNLDWEAICEKYTAQARTAASPIEKMQEWLAELHDTHTWVRPNLLSGDLPYEVWVDGDQAVFTKVPEDSLAGRLGVKPGFVLQGRDVKGWWRRTAATPHARPLVTGRRLLQAPVGTTLDLAALAPSGQLIEWQEKAWPLAGRPVVEWQRLAAGTGYLKIRAWTNHRELTAGIDEAFEAFKAASGLIVDLRGNGGGDYALATAFRDRFVPGRTLMGTIRYSTGYRQMSAPEEIWAEPAAESKRWTKKVCFLSDPLTYSSSEDTLLGLAGLEQVRVVGEASGGGSGRVQEYRLFPGWKLTISTALTYDRQGKCVEGRGIQPDFPLKPDRFSAGAEDIVLKKAEQLLG